MMLIYNHEILDPASCHISPDSRGFRYGDGFFETMRLVNGRLPLGSFHLDRLFASLQQLKFTTPPEWTPVYLDRRIRELVKVNGHEQSARVRVTVFRGEGGLYGHLDHTPQLLIQSWALPAAVWNENGLTVDIYRKARKAADDFSHIKSNNYLCYAMAALWAGEQQLDDALVLNANGRIADTTIANVFIVHDGVLKTPPLEEGCVSGVMRRYLLAAIRSEGTEVQEVPVTEPMLAEASELFLTNALSGIRWVNASGNNTYRHHLSALLYKKTINAHLW